MMHEHAASGHDRQSAEPRRIRVMNKLLRWIALSALSLAVIPFVSGCGESESSKQIKETSTTTSYAQPAPAIVQAPPSTINTTEEKSSSNSTEMGNNSTAESTNAYH